MANSVCEEGVRPSEGRRILLVEDHDGVRQMLSQVLVKLGFDVQAVADPEQALSAFDAGGHDAVITDYRLPHMTGLQLLCQIRQRCPMTGTVILSGQTSPDPGDPAGLVFADAWLMKSVRMEVIQTAIEDAIEAGHVRAQSKAG